MCFAWKLNSCHVLFNVQNSTLLSSALNGTTGGPHVESLDHGLDMTQRKHLASLLCLLSWQQFDQTHWLSSAGTGVSSTHNAVSWRARGWSVVTSHRVSLSLIQLRKLLWHLGIFSPPVLWALWCLVLFRDRLCLKTIIQDATHTRNY